MMVAGVVYKPPNKTPVWRIRKQISKNIKKRNEAKVLELFKELDAVYEKRVARIMTKPD